MILPKQLRVLIGVRVRSWREAQAISQDRLAAATGVTRSQIANIERGSTTPSLAALLSLAWALGVLPEKLLPDKDDLTSAWGRQGWGQFNAKRLKTFVFRPGRGCEDGRR